MTIIPPQKNNVPLGTLYMLISCLSFSVMGGLIRYVSDDVHPFLTAFYRTVIALLIMLPFFRTTGLREGLKTRKPGIHLLRGLASSFTIICTFYAVTVIPLADVMSYSFAAPIFATIGAVLVLGEKIRLPRIFAILFGFIGMLVLLRPGQMAINSGTVAALLSAITIAVTTICVRFLARTEKPHVITAYALLCALPVTFVFALPVWTWPGPGQLMVLVLIGGLASIAQICMSKAFSEAEASALMPFDFSRLIFSALIGYLFFDEATDIYTWIGASLIAGSALYAAHRERLRNKASAAPDKATDKTRPHSREISGEVCEGICARTPGERL
ncbi:DMT family transporter [Luteithermobacter gelatinilyticus]|uniref:DMT family transporter n=1 Tax=Luteithermobacter gelatinilyticus TaxID=2582913 RepID=UPI001106B8A3|nr:DMT family transporter [Luteithermobacter gelatinilyticus]